jgi:L-iditol 2-dehydrogenase
MRTLTCQKAHRLILEERSEPSPNGGELLLDLTACGLCGTDLVKIAAGSHQGRVLGHEIVGTVTTLGDSVADFAIGDRVVTPHHVACGICRRCRSGATTRCKTFQRDQLEPGGFSDRILIRAPAVEQAARKIPESLSTEAAIFLEPAACVLRGLDRAGLTELVKNGVQPAAVVLGGGSMGLLHLLVLRAVAPEARVILSEPDPWRRERASELGATAAVEPAALQDTVAKLTDREGVDAVFDTVGFAALLEPSVELLCEGGSLVLFAHFSDDVPGPFHQKLFHHERRVLGTYSGSLVEQDRVFDLLLDGSLQPQALVTHHIPMQQFEQALDLSRDPKALKILLVP